MSKVMDAFKDATRSTNAHHIAMIDEVRPMVDMFFEKDGEVAPFFSAKQADGGKSLIMTPWPSPEGKAYMLEKVAELFKEKGVVEYVQVSEAWVRSFAPGEEFDMDRGASTYPDREEVVMILAVDKDGATSVHYPIIRTNDGKPRLGPPSAPLHGGGGRMTELLPSHGSVH